MLAFITAGLFPAVIFGQSITQINPQDSNKYIIPCDNFIYLKPTINITSGNFTFFLRNNKKNTTQKYAPEGRQYLGLSANIFDLVIGLAVPVNKRTYADQSKSTDIRGSVFLKKWGGDFSIQRFEGLKNSVPSILDEVEFRKDILNKAITMNGYYIFNHRKFSLRSIYNQTEIQQKSAGSVLLHLYYAGGVFLGDSTLIDPGIRNYYIDYEGFKGVQNRNISILPGYSYTLVYNNIAANFSIEAGAGHSWNSFYYSTHVYKDLKIDLQATMKMGLVYNKNNLFSGFNFSWKNIRTNDGILEVSHSLSSLKLFLGYRFRKKGIFKHKLIPTN